MADSLRGRYRLSSHTHTHTRSVIGWEWTASPSSTLFSTNQMERTEKEHTHSLPAPHGFCTHPALFSEQSVTQLDFQVWCVYVCVVVYACMFLCRRTVCRCVLMKGWCLHSFISAFRSYLYTLLCYSFMLSMCFLLLMIITIMTF